jgi:hypothetical protein
VEHDVQAHTAAHEVEKAGDFVDTDSYGERIVKKVTKLTSPNLYSLLLGGPNDKYFHPFPRISMISTVVVMRGEEGERERRVPSPKFVNSWNDCSRRITVASTLI